MRSVQRDQVLVGHLVHRHVRDDADAHAETHIGLDDIGVRGGQHHVGRQAVGLEGIVQLAAAGEAVGIGDQRITGQRLEGQFLAIGQRVILGHQHAAIPAIARQQDEVVEQLQRLGADGEVGLPLTDHVGDLLRRALLHVQRDIRVLAREIGDHRRQGITRLGVRGGDRQAAATVVTVLLGDVLDVLHRAQHLACQLDDGLAGRGHPRQVLATAREDFDAKLIFQQTNLLGNARLGGIQTLRGGGHVQVVAGDFPDITQLLEFHAASLS